MSKRGVFLVSTNYSEVGVVSPREVGWAEYIAAKGGDIGYGGEENCVSLLVVLWTK